MTIDQLINIASDAYNDNDDSLGHPVKDYHNDPKGQHGDLLAAFVAAELQETYDEEEEDDDQHLETAMDCIDLAIEQLSRIKSALQNQYTATD